MDKIDLAYRFLDYIPDLIITWAIAAMMACLSVFTCLFFLGMCAKFFFDECKLLNKLIGEKGEEDE